ncbi:MAG TPA: PH domain-containing protein [Candidatus Bathyarchaeia archaeon]|nr:PH domain-containing protein [Candidatus Bathyarchaeia archaeon]
MPDIYVAPKKVKDSKALKKPKRKKQASEIEEVRKTHTANPLAAYVASPPDIRFENQEAKEKIVLLLRRHWMTNLPWLLIAGLMIILPPFVRTFPFFTFLPDRFQLMALIIWYLLTIAFIFEQFLIWFFNVNIITDERIVDIDFYSLLYKEVSDCPIDRIQDVTYAMGGVTRTVFDFGNVLIQTAAEVTQFEFLAVPQPRRIAAVLRDLMIEEEKEKLEGRVR